MALPKEYYRDNFLILVQYAVKRYASFFTATEHACFQTFFQFSPLAQALYIRLFNRKPTLFRQDKLHYPELAPLSTPLDELSTGHFVQTQMDTFPILTLLETFTQPELKQIGSSFSLQKNLKKEELLTQLHPLLEANRTALAPYAWVQILHKALFQRLLVLFFCNRSQTMTDFVLVDLGKTHYESYPIEEKIFYFPDRQALEAYLFWGEERDSFLELCAQKNLPLMKKKVEDLLNTPIPVFPASRYYTQMLFAGTRAYEYTQEWKRASELYEQLLAQAYHFEVASRYLLCLEKQWYYQTAREKTKKFLTEATSLTQQIFFQFHLQKQEKALKQKQTRFPPLQTPTLKTFSGQQTPHYLGSKATFQKKDSEQLLTVEEFVDDAFKEEGWEGVFAENNFILSCATFLCWEILFAPIPGVFQHPYQSGPLDLFSDSFYTRRQMLFTQHFQQLESWNCEKLFAYFQTQYTQKQSLQCSLKGGNLFELKDYFPFLEFSVGTRLVSLLKSLFQNLSEKCRGFPDFVFWKQNPLKLQIVEVKGPSDRLSDAQKSWIDLLIKLGYDVVLAQVLLPKRR